MKRLLRLCVIRKATVFSLVVYKYSISEKRRSPREQQNELAWKPSGTFPNSVERSQKPLARAVNRDTLRAYALCNLEDKTAKTQRLQ